MTLKPCPFCGSEDVKEVYTFYTIFRHSVYCKNCYTEGPAKPTEAEAVEAWNNRIKEPSA